MPAPARHGPSSGTRAAAPQTDAIERGWTAYREIVAPAVSVASTTDTIMAMLRLAFYGGAAHALGQLGAGAPDAWPATVAALSGEILDDSDRLLTTALLAASARSGAQ